MKKLLTSIVILSALLQAGAQHFTEPFSHGRLVVSRNGRFIVHEDGTPFYWFGDTAWELFDRLDMNEAEEYLDKRSRQGFTVIQAVILGEHDPLHLPRRNGHVPLRDNDPLQPDEDFFRFVDGVIDLAAGMGLYIGLLPTWGDKVDKVWGNGPVIFDSRNAYLYGKWLAERYRDRPNIIWIIGGDRSGGDGNFEVWDAMARGIKSADPNHLMTFHPWGEHSSSRWFHNCDWLDFNTFQSGHSQQTYEIYGKLVTYDLSRTPIKPLLDSEPRYENHPKNFIEGGDKFTAHDTRMAMYQSLFSGCFGHTYGCHEVWQMYDGQQYKPILGVDTPWWVAVDYEGAGQIIHARKLLERFDYESRVPDQSILLDGKSDYGDYAVATRGDGYALVYLPRSTPVTVSLDKIPGASRLLLEWYSPVDGTHKRIGRFKAEGTYTAVPESAGEDIILVMRKTR